MKRFILLIPAAIFPYTLLFSFYCIFTGFCMDFLFNNNAFILLFYLFLVFIIALFCNLVFLALSIFKKWNSHKICLANMIIKIIQIPAYILIFILGLIFFITIFTFGFTIFFIIFDCLAIFLTGIIGLSAIGRSYMEGKTSKFFSIINGICQFILCIDIISAIVIFIKSKSNLIDKSHFSSNYSTLSKSLYNELD